MKSLLKRFLLNTVAILVVSYFAPGLSYGDNVGTLLTAALVFSMVNAFLKPFLKIILLPINVITLGLTGWLVQVVILYLTTLVVPDFGVSGFTLATPWTDLVLSTPLAYVVISFFLSWAGAIIGWAISD